MDENTKESPLLEAFRVGTDAARLGFDWPDVTGPIAKVREELEELEEVIANGADPARLEDELGDLLFSLVNVARHLGVDPEAALRGTTKKFRRRFGKVEAWSGLGDTEGDGQGDGDGPDLDELEALWQRAKGEEDDR